MNYTGIYSRRQNSSGDYMGLRTIKTKFLAYPPGIKP
jgi:hypothetical protein